jgi:hypothetical protein
MSDLDLTDRWGLDPAGCPLCWYTRRQFDRLVAELLETRLQVADGPRHRVAELEATVAKQNAKIAALNARSRK